MNLTEHATKRCQQRGISADYVLLLEMLGTELAQKGNTYVLQLDKETKKSLTRRLKKLLMQVQRETYVVVSEDENVITVAHRH